MDSSPGQNKCGRTTTKKQPNRPRVHNSNVISLSQTFSWFIKCNSICLVFPVLQCMSVNVQQRPKKTAPPAVFSGVEQNNRYSGHNSGGGVLAGDNYWRTPAALAPSSWSRGGMMDYVEHDHSFENVSLSAGIATSG